MKKLLYLIIILTTLYSCSNSGKGYLIGAQDRETWFQPDPFGMLFIPQGSYLMGPSDQDVNYTQMSQSKSVTVQSFYMDETEVTNNEYRQFVIWVRDSIAHKLCGDQIEEYLIKTDAKGEEYPVPFVNWKKEIKWDGEEEKEPLAKMFLPDNERFYRRKEIDTRVLNFEYYWIDLKAASQKNFADPVLPSNNPKSENTDAASLNNRVQGLKDRSVFIKKDIINVYPDTLAYVHDFTYSFNEPMAQMYFWHPAYDNYPVVGVNWKQARAFCIWRTQLLNSYLQGHEETFVNDFRLPTESEWEWAARGGLDLSPYPWGGPYIRNSNGCFLGNYKPLRGNYTDDGGFHSIVVAHYAPNDFGLYDMAGNVSEWTSNVYDLSAYNFAHDLNMDYSYDAKLNDPPTLKLKVIRGGSWKDIGYYLQCSTRDYEFQDTAKCYIGFRCVQTYLGRQKGDGPNASNVY